MNKQSIYITMINTFLGLGASLLLKDNLAIAWIIGALIISTVIFIERVWLNENLFRKRKSYCLGAYTILTVIFAAGLFIVTEPMRKTSAIIASTTTFLSGIKAGEYENAYERLSGASKLSYPLADFMRDHAANRIVIKDFTINQVLFNKFDSKRATATVSSPFTLYGHETLSMELIKEGGTWRIVFSRNIVAAGKLFSPPKTKKKGGINNLLRSLF